MSPNRRLIAVFLALVAVFIGGFWLAEFYTDWLWYHHDAYAVVFSRRVVWKLALFVVSAAFVYGFLTLNLRYALRQRPAVRVLDDDALDPELRAWLDTIVPRVALWLPVLAAFMGGLGTAESWQLWLLAVLGVPFGTADPQFGLDVGFYVYRLGAFRQIVSSLSTLTIVLLILVVALYGHLQLIRVRDQELVFARSARNHILAVTAFFFVLRAGQQWLGRYGELLSDKGLFTGANWTSAHVTIPGLACSALLALAAAVVCGVVMAPHRPARPAYYAIAIHLLGSLLLTGLAPAVAHRLLVVPNEYEMEKPYLERAIAATRQAFGIDRAKERSFPAVANLKPADLARNRATIEDIRIWDHRPLLRTFAQLQEIRQYYDIIDVDSDRYQVDGRLQQVLIAARELNHHQLDIKAKSWVNLHLDYTHGYGTVVSSASRMGNEGQPQFLAKDIPTRSVPGLEVTQPRLYFGEAILLPPEETAQQSSLMPRQQETREATPTTTAERLRERFNSGRESDDVDYLLVGTRDEFDYAETVGDQEVKHRTRYQGKSGIPAGGLLRRIALGLRLHSVELAISNLVTPQTRLLLHRQVTRRCRRAAPFLVWDTNPYPVVVDGRTQWICEAYTYSLSYPYAESYYRPEMTARGPQYRRTWNYVRNSVKAVVDAYDGTVMLYVVDPADPLIRSYDRIFPGMLRPVDQAPAELRRHFRYPVLLFKSQAEMYRAYHMTDPRTFYNQEDLWATAREVDREAVTPPSMPGRQQPSGERYKDMDPYYITMSLPGESTAQFMLINAFTPFSTGARREAVSQRDNLIAWMGALCDPDRYGELVIYTFPKNTNIYGPLQVEARIDQDDAISQQITLWDRGGSRVIRGNLMIIPVESSLLYVQPLYLESEKRGLPELKRIIVSYEDRVVMEATVAAALQRLFGVAVGGPSAPAAPAAAPTSTAPAAKGKGVDPRLLAAAEQAFTASEEALRAGDWGRYQQERERLRQILGQMR